MNHHHAIAGLLLAASLAATRVVAAADAPPDRGPVADADDDGPAALRGKLRELRLIDG